MIEKKYRLERELGAGGMGAVWLATQLMVDRPVAVKLLHPSFVDQDDLQARFEVEAKAIGRLNHPNVITLYDFGYSNDLEAFYTVIEYINGVSLDKRLNERMPLVEIVSIIRQIALALDHAHHFGILHRDLKPENVMLSRMTDGTEIVKVLDFGIARIVKGTYDTESPESQRITKAGEVFGTPAYMSPEQARSIRRLQPSSDLYSLGVMFYELVNGSLPFFAKSAFDLLMLHVTKPVPAIQRTDVPPEVLTIIYRLLEKEPDRRFQSGKELANALERLHLPATPVSDGEEYDAVPTLMGNAPTLERDPPPVNRLGDEETNPDAAAFVLPTPVTAAQQAPPPHVIRAPTVLMHGGGEAVAPAPAGTREFETVQTEGGASVIRGFVVLFGLILAVGLTAVFIVTRNAPPRDEPLPPSKRLKQVLQPPSSDPDDEQASADPVEPPTETADDPAPQDEPDTATNGAAPPDEPEEAVPPTKPETAPAPKKDPEPATKPKRKPPKVGTHRGKSVHTGP